MAITEQLEAFGAFARRLEEQRGGDVSLDEAMRLWQEIDHKEAGILRERLSSYDAGAGGRPVREFLAQRRASRNERSE